MRLPSRLISALPLSAAMILGPGAMTGCNQQRVSNDRGDGVVITMAELTPEARATIERELGTAKLAELRRVDNDQRGEHFEAEFMRDSREVGLDVSADGLVYAVEETVNPAELPEAVRDAVQRELPTSRITEADRIVAAGVVTFEVEAEMRLTRWELTLSPDGTITKKDMTQINGKANS